MSSLALERRQLGEHRSELDLRVCAHHQPEVVLGENLDRLRHVGAAGRYGLVRVAQEVRLGDSVDLGELDQLLAGPGEVAIEGEIDYLRSPPLYERAGHRVELAVPQRGEKRSLVDLAGQNAKQSYIQRFRVLEPSRKAIQEALADALMLPELPRRIECFDISHIQGAETVASLVVWEDGKMNKQAYRKFKVITVAGVDDFASMREVVHRRYRRLLEEAYPTQSPGFVTGHDFSRAENAPNEEGALAPARRTSKEPKTLPSLILIDGGLGQLHAAAEALESLDFASADLAPPPLASIAKREEVIYRYGNEQELIVLDRRSPVLHLVQLIRDESHRFAVGYHRQRRAIRDRDSELLAIPGVGPQTRKRLLTHFGSLRDIQQATAESLAAVVPRKTAETIWRHFHETKSVP